MPECGVALRRPVLGIGGVAIRSRRRFEHAVAALQPAIALGAGHRFGRELADALRTVAVAQEEQRAYRRFGKPLALLFAGVAVHHRPQAIEILLTLGVGEVGRVAVRELPDGQILLAPRLPHLSPEFQNAHALRSQRQRGLLQGGHALTRRAARVCSQHCRLENIHDHRLLPVLVVEGDLPLGGFAQILERVDAVHIALRRQRGHLHHETAHFREGFICRRAQRGKPAVSVGVAAVLRTLSCFKTFTRKHTELERRTAPDAAHLVQT